MNEVASEVVDQMEELLGQALAGKYPIADEALRSRLIRPTLQIYRHTPAADLPQAIPVVGVGDDVQNQVVTLMRIELDWIARYPPNVDLATIHTSLYGDLAPNEAFRTTEFVEDYDGSPPTRVADIEGKILEIDHRLSLVDDLSSGSLVQKSEYLAWLVSTVIAVHAFADGNGRLARSAAQYCLRRWGMDFMPIPKVRNAPRYKAALHRAIDGERSELAAYFVRLISKGTVADIE